MNVLKCEAEGRKMRVCNVQMIVILQLLLVSNIT